MKVFLTILGLINISINRICYIVNQPNFGLNFGFKTKTKNSLKTLYFNQKLLLYFTINIFFSDSSFGVSILGDNMNFNPEKLYQRLLK